jgi:plastocyanin
MKNILHKCLHLFPFTFILLVALVLTSCSSGNGTTSTTTSSPVSGSYVSLVNLAFSPATLTVKVGTTITWTNNDSMTHTVTSDNGVFDSGNLTPGQTFSYTFNNAGTFTYHCVIHSYMKGTIIVQ